jgi:CO/xanthine dehydrogenase FAD-binding subunit
MRAFVPSYQLISPANLGEALDVLARESGVWKPFAGGTDLMVLLEAGKLPHKKYLNIWNLPELRGIEVSDHQVTLGALTTYTQVQDHATLREEFPMLGRAASETGGLAIQNRGTLGGNIVNASPAADSPPALLAYDAELELVSQEGVRSIPYSKFHTGYKEMSIRPDELLRSIRLPRTSGRATHYYRKVGTRKTQAISKACFAAVAWMNGDQIEDVRIALGSVAPIPIRCVRTESALRSKSINAEALAAARTALAAEIAPIDDLRSTRDYRLRVSINLLEDFVLQLAPTQSLGSEPVRFIPDAS